MESKDELLLSIYVSIGLGRIAEYLAESEEEKRILREATDRMIEGYLNFLKVANGERNE